MKQKYYLIKRFQMQKISSKDTERKTDFIS